MLDSKGIVVKCTAAIFLRTMDCALNTKTEFEIANSKRIKDSREMGSTLYRTWSGYFELSLRIATSAP